MNYLLKKSLKKLEKCGNFVRFHSQEVDWLKTTPGGIH